MRVTCHRASFPSLVVKTNGQNARGQGLGPLEVECLYDGQ